MPKPSRTGTFNMIEHILPDLYKIEIPLLGSPLKALNTYVIKSEYRNLIVDTGWNTSECLNAMLSGLRQLKVDLERTDFFITHFHADHLALLPELARDSATVYFNRPDAQWVASGLMRKDLLNFACANGFPEKDRQALLQNHPAKKFKHPKQPVFSILKDNDDLRVGDYRFSCVQTPGHTRGHMCLYEADRKVLVCGDHLLDRITPIIQLWSDEENPLEEYLASLDKVQALDIDLVLPGHSALFKNAGERIQELKRHHMQRCDEILSILRQGRKNAFQIASQATWSIQNRYDSWDKFPLQQKWFATGETISHLKYLQEQGRVQRDDAGETILFF